MGRYQSGQMGRTVNPLLRLRRFESFSPHMLMIGLLIFRKPASLNKSGSSSVGRAIAFQAIGREFEPRLPLGKVIQLLSYWLSKNNSIT